MVPVEHLQGSRKSKLMRSVVRDLAVLALLGGLVLFTNLGGPRLWDRDEPRNAGCAWEMQERGEWIVPWFNGELRTHKPILLYWLIRSAYAVFGVDEFAARFWSAALGIATVGLTYGMGRRLFGPRVAFWAGLILLTTLMFDVASHAATPDAVLIFCVTLSLTIFVVREFPAVETGQARDWSLPLGTGTAIAMYAAMGLAVLAKGPVGAVLPTAVVGMFLLLARLPAMPADAERPRGWRRLAAWARPWAPRHFFRTCLAMRPLIAIALILAVAGPWYAAVGWRTDGEFLRGFFWTHNVARAVQSFEGHRGGLWFYPVALLIGFFPWSVFALPCGWDLRRRWSTLGAERWGVIFALAWAGVWVGLFSLARTKLPSYVTPAYPALALVVATYVSRWSDGATVIATWLQRLPLAALAVTGGVLVVALPLVARRFLPGAEWLGVLGLVPLLGASATWWLQRQERRRWAAVSLSATAVAFVGLLFGLVPAVVDRYQQIDVLLVAIQRRGAAPEVGALGGLEPSWIFYGRRPIHELVLDAPPSVAVASSPYVPRPLQGVAEFLEANDRRVVIAHGRQMDELRRRFAGRLVVLADAPKFLKNDRLYLVTLDDALAQRPQASRQRQ